MRALLFLVSVTFATADEINAAIASAKAAFKTWRKTPIGARARIFLKLQQLIRENMADLAATLTAEQGKTLADAEGDVFRGLEVVEHAANIGTLQMGEFAENVAGAVDTYTLQQPLGVCAGITPFNFPVMVPSCSWPSCADFASDSAPAIISSSGIWSPWLSVKTSPSRFENAP